MPPRRQSTPAAVALIGDIVGSRRIPDGARARAQEGIERALQRLNKRYRHAVLSRFLVTLGDECQGLLTAAGPIPDIIWDLERDLAGMEFRWGIGYGRITTPLRDEALGMDGPALHRAREAIEDAKHHDRLGGVFRGFDAEADQTASALARLLHHQRAGYTGRQREVVESLRKGERVSDIAGKIRLSRQAVSLRSRAAGWPVYAEGEDALRKLLARYDASAQWRRSGWRG